jgi:hypothetical protein
MLLPFSIDYTTKKMGKDDAEVSQDSSIETLKIF